MHGPDRNVDFTGVAETMRLLLVLPTQDQAVGDPVTPNDRRTLPRSLTVKRPRPTPRGGIKSFEFRSGGTPWARKWAFEFPVLTASMKAQRTIVVPSGR